MINKILDGISVALYEAFGEEYNIYSETVKQDFEEPCFFIMPISFSDTPKVGHLSRKEISFDVHFFPRNSVEPNSEGLKVYEHLCKNLAYVQTEIGLLRGINMRGEKADGVLHFFVDYNLNVIVKAEKGNMEEVEIKPRLGG